MEQRKHSLNILAVSGWALALIMMFAYITHGWTAPTAEPPNANISAPINVGSASQTKTGAFTLNGALDVNNSASFNPASNSTSSFKITNASDVSMFNVNSTASEVTVQGSAAGPSLTLGSTAALGPLTISGVNSYFTGTGAKVGIGAAPTTNELEVTGSISATDTITATSQMCLAASCISTWPTGGEGGGVPSTGIVLSTIDNNATILAAGFTQTPGAIIQDTMMTNYYIYTKTP